VTHFLSLITNPADASLSPEIVDKVRRAAASDADPVWLAQGIAAEIAIDAEAAADRVALLRRSRAEIDRHPIDVALLPADGREKKLLIADMDSTIIGQECVDELADYAGLRDEISAITERAMNGELRFEDALRDRVALLRGVPVTVIDEIVAERIVVNPGAGILVATMRARGAHTALVSGGFRAFTRRVSDMVGFDEDFANDLVVADGMIAGEIVEPVRGREGKRQALLELAAGLHISSAEAIAVGDGANDIDMIDAAGLGVAYHAKPAVAERADARIDYGDFTALLYLQGIRAEEFVT
jgi:phosphoserine phosphatase